MVSAYQIEYALSGMLYTSMVSVTGLRLMEKYETAEVVVEAGGRFIPPVSCKNVYTRKIPR